MRTLITAIKECITAVALLVTIYAVALLAYGFGG